MNQIQMTDTILAITEAHPQTVDVLVAYGLDKLQNPALRQSLGKTMTLATLCKLRQLDGAALLTALNAVVKPTAEGVRIKGILPCPIRIPLMDKITPFVEQSPVPIDHTLPAASTGLDWLMAESESKEQLADVYLSAGFDLFFNHNGMGKFAKEGVFAPLDVAYNNDFDNDHISLRDPKGIYTVLGMVPAIFMVNKAELGQRPMPKSWQDLFSPIYSDSIAIPMKDLDLFNAVLLGIYHRYGQEGVAQLGSNILKSMHPAQMVKNASANRAPAVSVAPYFFASMLPEGGDMVAVWPEDGAIVSPVFLVAKADSLARSQPLIDFLTSKEIGTVLASNGRFPSTVAGVDNSLTGNEPFLFCGFDFLHSCDVDTCLKTLEAVFLGKEEV
ncbi:ABC transporter substrate-binding protein [Bengtsoniella intestinalis]|uniref:ABC transporter substrate-binding protein n=1 Tax=Bengtsoniella intestinalis TaxID=3073143 RepID=UPI00391FC19F